MKIVLTNSMSSPFFFNESVRKEVEQSGLFKSEINIKLEILNMINVCNKKTFWSTVLRIGKLHLSISAE